MGKRLAPLLGATDLQAFGVPGYFTINLAEGKLKANHLPGSGDDTIEFNFEDADDSNIENNHSTTARLVSVIKASTTALAPRFKRELQRELPLESADWGIGVAELPASVIGGAFAVGAGTSAGGGAGVGRGSVASGSAAGSPAPATPPALLATGNSSPLPAPPAGSGRKGKGKSLA